jgi:molybdopterin biosynthesis enzyme
MLCDIDLEKALELLCEGVGLLPSEERDLLSANGRVLAWPLPAAMTGDKNLAPVRVSAELADDFNKKGGARRFVRGRFDGNSVHLPDGHSNGQIRSLIGCNCLVDVPAGSGELRAGDRVSILLFPGAAIFQTRPKLNGAEIESNAI